MYNTANRLPSTSNKPTWADLLSSTRLPPLGSSLTGWCVATSGLIKYNFLAGSDFWLIACLPLGVLGIMGLNYEWRPGVGRAGLGDGCSIVLGCLSWGA